MLIFRLPLIRCAVLGLLLNGAGLLAPAAAQAQIRSKRGAAEKVAAAAVLAPPCGAPPASAAGQAQLAEAAELLKNYRESEALGRYERVLAQAPATYEALWRAAVLSVRVGNRYTDESRRFAYYAAARLYANRALVVCPEGAEGHYAAAQVLAAEAPLRPLRSRLLAYREMRPHVYQATEMRPDWAEAWQQLGRWHYRVDHYSLPERLYSRLFLGGVPAGGSTLLAIEALRRAYELEPQRIEVAYDLARVYLNRSQYTRARQVLQAALQLTPVTAEELVINRRCQKLLEKVVRRQNRQLPRLSRLLR
ncbi:tetratricopeptide repeat protein [Hymenobacter aerophilus]|uniref:tetratricopeptide repeat protein n=1 Tax=Hymenobacter aerophilus TaxID=119644 RepID=UPI00037BA597|nr:tetratricopeptide repeat protein [Hymenobacter aerophilus]